MGVRVEAEDEMEVQRWRHGRRHGGGGAGFLAKEEGRHRRGVSNRHKIWDYK